MKIYFYDKDTKEYLGSAEADKNPAASKRTGSFVPLIPPNAVLIKHPAVLNNQIQVYNPDKKEWDVFSDYRKNFCKIDKDLNVSEITEIGSISPDYILVTKDIAEEIKKLKDKFKIENNKIVQKSDEEFEAEQKQKEAERIANLSLTKRDVLLALFDDKGITPEQIEAMLDTRGLIEFKYAASYYRGNPLIDKLGAALGYTKEQLDYLFENKEFKKEIIN